MVVFILLDGVVAPLRVEPIAGQGQPIDLIPLSPVPSGVRESFQRGALAMHNALIKKGWPIRHTAFAYHVETDIAERLYGGSGALAFAIAIMYGMLGRPIPRNIGATGAIQVGAIRTGSISQIELIKEKLEFAVGNIENGLIFYPYENRKEIFHCINDIKEGERKNNTKSHPVHNLYEIIKILIGFRWKKYAYLLITLLFIGFFIYKITSDVFIIHATERCSSPIVDWYLKTINFVAFWNEEIQSIYRDYKIPLNVEMTFLVLLARGEEKHYRIDMIPHRLSVSNQDKFAIAIHASTPVYPYIYQFDRDKTAKKLYPTSMEDALPQEVAAFPGKGMWFNPDGVDGKVEIAIILCRWRCTDLETFSSSEDLKQSIACRDNQGVSAQVHRISFRQKF